MTNPKLERAEPWAPHPMAAPRTDREDDRTFSIAANGTRTCSGGCQFVYADIEPEQTYRFECAVEHEGIEHPRDVLLALVFWGELAPDDRAKGPRLSWEYLLPECSDGRTVRFTRVLAVPEGTKGLTIRCVFRWSAAGRSEWSLPEVCAVPAPPSPPPVKVAVVTGNVMANRERKRETIQDNVEYYGGLCERVCQQEAPGLILLPEIVLQWLLPGSGLDNAVAAPGPETEVFAGIARRTRTRIVLGLIERDGDAVHNSAVLIGPEGEIDGRYHKVHLATGESESGILPGDSFPVFGTEVGRLGCNICMDSSAAESSRMVGLNGADFLLLPIMGDHRSDRWTPGQPIFNESRWKAVMRTRALDNQLSLVVARNEVQGSCIMDRKGDILAWNEGDRDWITADVPRRDGYRAWNNGCFRSVNWMQRRPHVYGEFVNPWNLGSLR